MHLAYFPLVLVLEQELVLLLPELQVSLLLELVLQI